MAAFLEEREVNDANGGKTHKEEIREKIATIKKLLDENDNPRVKIAMIKKLLDENDNPRVLPIALSALHEKRQVNEAAGEKTLKEEMRENIATIKKLLDEVSNMAEICRGKLERKNVNGDCTEWIYFRPVMRHGIKTSRST